MLWEAWRMKDNELEEVQREVEEEIARSILSFPLPNFLFPFPLKRIPTPSFYKALLNPFLPICPRLFYIVPFCIYHFCFTTREIFSF